MMKTLEEILQEEDDFSEMSIEPSFTLSDILKQPPDSEPSEPSINEDNIDDFFENEDEQMFDSPQPYVKEASKPESLSEHNKRMTEISHFSMSKFSYQVQRWRRLQDLPITPFEEIRNMSYTMLKNVTKLFDTTEAKGVGIPTCIAGTGSRFLGLGTSLGNIAVFEVQVPGYKTLGEGEQKKHGPVTSISISRDNHYLVAGYESGLITIWDLVTWKLLKQQKPQPHRILKVLFCCDTSSSFASTDEYGYTYLFTIDSGFWMTSVKYQLLLDRSDSVYFDVKYSKLESGREVLAMCEIDGVLLLSLRPWIGIMGRLNRPEGVASSIVPHCEIGRSQTHATYKGYDILCVSWGNSIVVYRLMLTPHNACQQLIQLFKMQHPTPIHHLQLISDGLLVSVDEHQGYRVVNVQDSYQKQKCIIITHDNLQSETVYQRLPTRKQKQQRLHLYSNTMVSCSFNPKYKEIFFILADGVMRGRLDKWTDYVYSLIKQQKNWYQTLKLCVELSNGHYGIFAEPFILNKVTLDLLCDIGRIFLKEGLTQLHKQNNTLVNIDEVRTEAQQLFDITIQYFIWIKCEDYLFNTVLPLIRQKYFYEYEEEFIRCLQPFIEQHLLHKIPNREAFTRILFEYESKPELLQELILALHYESIYYEDTVEVCTRMKLYPSLCYVSAVYGDFISPANKLLIHSQQATLSHYNNAAKTTMNYLTTYLHSLIKLEYPNPHHQRSLTSEHSLMVFKDVRIWLTSVETMGFMMGWYGEEYWGIVGRLTEKMVEFNNQKCIHEMMGEIMRGIEELKHQEVEEEFKEVNFPHKLQQAQIEVATLLLSISTKLKLQREEVQWVVEHPSVLVDRTQLPKCLAFLHRHRYEIENLSTLHLPDYLKLFSSIILAQPIPEHTTLPPELSHPIIQYILSNCEHELISPHIDMFLECSPTDTILYLLRTQPIKVLSKRLQNIKDDRRRYLLLRKLLTVLRQKGSDIKLQNDVMFFYLQCLCRWKKEKRVWVELVSYPTDYVYMLERVLPMVQKYKLGSCLGFLYEQELNYHRAFHSYATVYKHYFNTNFQKLVHYIHCHGRFMAKMYDKMLQLCGYINERKQWLSLMSVVLSPLEEKDPTQKHSMVIQHIQELYQIKECQSHPFILQLFEIIESMLVNVNKEVPMQVLTYELERHVSLLTHTFILNCLESTLRGFSRRADTYRIGVDVLVADSAVQFHNIMDQHRVKGLSVEAGCWKCGTELNQDVKELEVFSCGHGYHRECLSNPSKCELCTSMVYGEQIKRSSYYPLQPPKSLHLSTSSHHTKSTSKNTTSTVYKCLAFEDFIASRDHEFQAFQNEFEKHLEALR